MLLAPASFQLFTGLLDLRSVMRFLSSFPPAVGYVLFSPAVGYALFLWLTSTIHLLSASDPRLHLVSHLEPQNLLRSMQQEVTLEVHRILVPLSVDGHKSALTSSAVLKRGTCGVGPAHHT